MNTTVIEFMESTLSTQTVSLSKVVSIWLWTYASPFVILFGIIGNSLTIALLLSKHLGNFPSAPYLAILAVVDSSVLVSGLFRRWMRFTFDINTEDENVFVCKIRYFVVHSSRMTSVWLIVALTLDRFICVVFPFKAREVRRKHRIILASVVTVLCSLLNSHRLYGMDLRTTGFFGGITTLDCNYYYDDYVWFIYNIEPFLDIVFFCALPFLLLTSLNTAIVVTLKFARRPDDRPQERSDKSGRMTKLALLLSTSFLLTTTPFTVYIMYMRYEGADYVSRPVLLACLFLLANFNHAMNFFLYCASGPRFRKALMILLGCSKPLAQ